MKLLFKLLPIFLVTAFISCQKEISFEPGQGGGGSGTGVNGLLKMKIDGKQWVADKAAAGSLMAGVINITGMSKDGKTFTVTLADTIARTYTFSNEITSLDSMNGAAFSDTTYFSNNSWGTAQGDNPAQVGGWINIAKIDKSKKTMSGTFQIKMFRELDSNTIVITEGSFVDLSYATSLPPANATDTLKVKIAGTPWTASSLTAVNSNGVLAIVANENPMNRTVGLMLPPGITPGSYTLDFFGAQYVGMYNPNVTTALVSTSGTLTILEHNTSTKRIRGNFNFVAEPVLGGTGVNLTEGYFSVKYQ